MKEGKGHIPVPFHYRYMPLSHFNFRPASNLHAQNPKLLLRIRVLNTYVISKFYRIPYLSHLRLIFLSNFEIYLLYGDVRYWLYTQNAL